MNQDTEQKIIGLLREIRDGQREALSTMEEYRSLVKEQIQISRGNVEESINLQRIALKRQRVVTLIAVPGIVACIAAIAYLVFRYF